MKEKKHASILAVDDSILNLKLLNNLLISQGYQVYTAPDGKTAKKILESEDLDLVLLDIHLPDDNGIEICRHLKAQPRTQDIPVIFISAMDSVDDKVLGFESGGSDYVTKPFHREEVLVRVKTQIMIRELQESLKLKIKEMEGLYKEVKELSIRDALTGLYNRRYLNEALEAQLSNAKRYKKPITIILGDVDHFKLVNDRFSHQVGDEVLKLVGTTLGKSIRESDTASRYGGEEFFISLPETPLSQALMVAERVRSSVEQAPWESIHPDLKITISLGMASLETQEDWDNLDQSKFLSRADEQLYKAKSAGRNCIKY